jgi:hypothetical protein
MPFFVSPVLAGDPCPNDGIQHVEASSRPKRSDGPLPARTHLLGSQVRAANLSETSSLNAARDEKLSNNSWEASIDVDAELDAGAPPDTRPDAPAHRPGPAAP